jgi:esterase
MAMNRFKFQHDGLTLSYLDSGGEFPVIIALHAHWMEGVTFFPLAEALGSEWRLITLDQRGHGDSDHAQTYTREDYLGDLEALFRHIGLKQAVLLGNSLGGVNAYQFAARYPQQVRALVIEDVGVEVPGDLPPMLSWEGTFAKREELENAIGPRMLPYLQDSFRHTPSGWRLAFAPKEMRLSQDFLAGNYWSDWLATDCPALVIHGTESRVTTAAHVIQMAERRANTQLCSLEGGHVVHQDNATAFAAAVRSFLRSCRSTSRTVRQEQHSS